MKKLALIVATFAIAHTGYSQISVDPEIGLNMSNIRTQINDEDAEYSDMKAGLSVGAGVSIDLYKGLYIKPGAYYQMMGGENETLGMTTTTTMHYLRIPVNLGYRYTFSEKAGSIFAEAGPYVGYAFSGTNKSETIIGDVENDVEFGDELNEMKPLDFGLNFAVGYETPWGIYIKGGYGLGLNNLSNVDDVKVSNNNMNLAIGYSIKL